MAASRVDAVDDEERRETILLAAERCFERWGVLRTRMEDIASEARIARPALYRYFAGKDAILSAVLVRHIDQRAAELHDKLRLKGAAAPLILDALLTGIQNTPDPTLLGAILEVDVLHDTARLVGQSDAVFDAMSGYWRPYLEYARDRGELRSGVGLDEAVRWLTLIVFYFLTVPEIVPPRQKLRSYLKTFVVNALVA
jgi:AcrR family transcriptional regulator